MPYGCANLIVANPILIHTTIPRFKTMETPKAMRVRGATCIATDFSLLVQHACIQKVAEFTF